MSVLHRLPLRVSHGVARYLNNTRTMTTKTLFSEPMRLACRECDREDADGVFEIPEGWQRVFEESDNGDDYQWWTHSGVCPDCAHT